MRLFDKDGMTVQSTAALSFDNFKYAGELMAMSIVQGGPAPNFLSPCLYDVVSKGLWSVKLDADMIEELEMKEVACEVRVILTQASSLLVEVSLVLYSQRERKETRYDQTLCFDEPPSNILDVSN